MEMLKNWVNCILIVVVMVGIIEVIVPEGETKKFVFLITRVSISIVIALPILKLIKNDFAFEDIFNIKYIEENDFYVDTLRSTVERQTSMLETVYSQNVVNKFNSEYKDMQISGCKIHFTKDESGKIQEINLVEVTTKLRIDDKSLLKKRIAEICEVNEEKVSVN